MAVVEQRKEGSRERILDGASEEFAAHGFAGARIDRISRRTKLNVRMIYYHFGSKKGLYRAVLESIYETMSVLLERADTKRGSVPAVEAFKLYSDLITDEPRFADILVRELLDGAKQLRALWKERPELFERIHTRARSIVEAGIATGKLRKLDPEMTVLTLTTTMCFVMATRHSHSLFLDGRTPKMEEVKAHVFDLIIGGLGR